MRVVARQRARVCLDSEIRKPRIRPVEESNEMSGRRKEIEHTVAREDEIDYLCV